MKRISKVLAVLMALALVMGFAAMSASAATTGETFTTFDKNLVVDSTAQIPTIGFDFDINPGTAIPGTSTTLSIKAGVGSPVIVNNTNPSAAHDAMFDGSMIENATAGTPTNASETGKVYVTDTVKIDFSGVTFTEPGIYRYVITEDSSPALPGVTYDGSTRYLDVFVEKDGTDFEITGYAMRNQPDTFSTSGDPMEGYSAEENPDVKESSFTNFLDTYDLTFSKTISGNQADMSKRFTFTLNITGANPGEYEIVVSSADVLVDGEDGSHVTSGKITVASDGTYTGTFSLTNNDTVTVKDLNKGATYTVREDPEDYIPSVDGTSNTYTSTGTLADADASTAFTNTHNGIIPTGVIITIAPFMIGLLLFGAVILVMVNRRRRAAY